MRQKPGPPPRPGPRLCPFSLFSPPPPPLFFPPAVLLGGVGRGGGGVVHCTYAVLSHLHREFFLAAVLLGEFDRQEAVFHRGLGLGKIHLLRQDDRAAKRPPEKLL